MDRKASAASSADRQQTVIAQHQMARIAEMLLQARLLLRIERDPFVVVIRERLHDDARLLRNRQQTRLLAGHRDALHRMQMQHATRVFARLVNCAVNRVARGIDVVRRLERLCRRADRRARDSRQ